MNNYNYRLVRERVYLAIAVVKLAQEIVQLLNMAFNYYTSDTKHVCQPQQHGYRNFR